MKKGFYLAILALVFLAVPSWSFAYNYTGDAIEDGSWKQRFVLDAPDTPTNKIEIFMTSGADFEADGGVSNATVSGWTTTVINPTYAVSTGPVMNVGAQFDIYFGGNVAALTFDIIFWGDEGVVSAYHSTYNGNWYFTQFVTDGSGYDRSPVPIPGAVWLLGSGLIGLAGIRRRFKRS